MRKVNFIEELGMERLNRLELCVFQREKKGEWESGLLLNEGNLGILDKRGNKVTKLWDYRTRSDFTVEIGDILKRYDSERFDCFDHFRQELPEIIGKDQRLAEVIREHFIDAWDELRARKGNLKTSDVLQFCAFVEYNYLYNKTEADWWNNNAESVESWQMLDNYLRSNHPEKYPPEW